MGIRRPQAGQTVTKQLLVLEAALVVGGLVAVVGLEWIAPGTARLIAVAVATLLAISALGGLLEALAAIRLPEPPPASRVGARPAVTGIIAAYLPNEAEIIVETVIHHLRVGPADLQLIVAYNRPDRLPVEDELAEIARADPRLTLLPVDGSRSKAENVNAALDRATGEVVGVFDADHHPALDAYERAWRWLANDADVVQGHCVVRRRSRRTRTLLEALVTVEFEQMYTVSHPGRTRIHGFGLFGGSNGYWRADVLRAIRLDPSVLTEDIDASIRLLRVGGRIVTDPAIVSDELPPPGLQALCHQRLRWSQGWLQVARRHLRAAADDRNLSLRSRAGLVWLFGLGSLTPWIGGLSVPLLLHQVLVGGVGRDANTVMVLAAGSAASAVIQAVVAYRHADAHVRRPLLFAGYLLASAVVFTHLRNALARLAHVHEALGHREWRVTPRPVRT